MNEIEELRNNLKEHILNLGIDKKIMDNPAFLSAITRINSMIEQMNIQDADKVVEVTENNGIISINWNSVTNDKYNMKIASSSPDSFYCVRTLEKNPRLGNNGQMIHEKEVIENIIAMSNNGALTITSNSSIVNDINCDSNTLNNTTFVETMYYTTEGVMSMRESKSFKTTPLIGSIDKIGTDAMLYTPRNEYMTDKYSKRRVLYRNTIDTARILEEDKNNNTKYSSVVRLNMEHGLKNMTLPNIDIHQKDVYIPKISVVEINEMINQEKDEKVRKGLSLYAVDRENYEYDSRKDPNFVMEGFNTSHNVSR